jgi:hypothetical protein
LCYYFPAGIAERTTMEFFSFTAGTILLLLALLARTLGIDHDARWGTGRYLLLFSGLLLSSISALVYASKKSPTLQAWLGRYRRLTAPAAAWVRKMQRNFVLSVWAAVIVWAALAGYSTWYASVGRFPYFPPVGNYHVDLGEGFLRGQLSLPQQPDPKLAALKNPYDPHQFESVPYLWDVSYYQGRYYLYWGPVPALMNAGFQLLTGSRPPDAWVMLFSVIGISALWGAILFLLRKRWFPHAPGISIPLCLLAAGVNVPILFLLGRPQVYETAIIAGQFFLWAGVLSWLMYITRPKKVWLVLTGLGWGLAIGSRINLALSVGVYAGFAMLYLFRNEPLRSLPWKKGFLLLFSSFLCVLGLGFYNYARFGSFLETGLKYQLTMPIPQSFSTGFFASNLYMYLLYFSASARPFPFLKFDLVNLALLPSWAGVTKNKRFDEVFLGLLPAVPLIGWVVGLSPVLLRKAKNTLSSQKGRVGFLLMLVLAGALQFVFLMLFYYGAMRYIYDFFLPLLLAVVFIAWWLDERLREQPKLRIAFWFMAALLVCWTVGAGFFAGFDIPPQYFRTYNPALYQSIASVWNPIYYHVLALPDHLGVRSMLNFLQSVLQ